jgi:hypothetical protein
VESLGRTRKTQANVEALEKQLGAVRAKIERGTENLALANLETRRASRAN